MLKTGIKIPILLLIVFTIFTCVDPYAPKLAGYKHMLVVEGRVTNDNRSCVVKLSLSKQADDTVSSGVRGASIYLSDEEGNISDLTEYSDGIYKTDSLGFKGEIGKSYQLHLRTSEGNEYASDKCTMYPVPDIDTVYYEKDEKLTKNQTVAQQGISIYIDTKPGYGGKQFLRWDFEETWKFKVPFPTVFIYVNEDTILQSSVADIHQYCYKSSRSSDILAGEISSGESGSIKKQLINFIAPKVSDRLTLRYSILINQYSISQKEYNFWSNLREMNETEGDIFGSQPFPVLSNIRNVTDPNEPVLGYFSVSAVKHVRKYINFNDLIHLNIPFNNTTCRLISKNPGEYSSWGHRFTFDDLYKMFMTTPGYAFVEPFYNPVSGALSKLVFTFSECADCRVTGSERKPDFWTE